MDFSLIKNAWRNCQAIFEGDVAFFFGGGLNFFVLNLLILLITLVGYFTKLVNFSITS